MTFSGGETHQQQKPNQARNMKQSSQDKTPPLNRPAPLREAFVLAGVLASLALAGKSVAAPFVGNISPNAIEIDSSANLYPSGAAGLVDWVNDSLPNTDTGTLINSVANGIIPNVTGVSGGKGHWNGVRIVDGVGGAENDIFINGGKENDAAHWSIGPGSGGSPQYTITQRGHALHPDPHGRRCPVHLRNERLRQQRFGRAALLSLERQQLRGEGSRAVQPGQLDQQRGHPGSAVGLCGQQRQLGHGKHSPV